MLTGNLLTKEDAIALLMFFQEVQDLVVVPGSQKWLLEINWKVKKKSRIFSCWSRVQSFSVFKTETFFFGFK